eukprot:6183190-Pleurochrysis_carterae.AAC.2
MRVCACARCGVHACVGTACAVRACVCVRASARMRRAGSCLARIVAGGTAHPDGGGGHVEGRRRCRHTDEETAQAHGEGCRQGQVRSHVLAHAAEIDSGAMVLSAAALHTLQSFENSPSPPPLSVCVALRKLLKPSHSVSAPAGTRLRGSTLCSACFAGDCVALALVSSTDPTRTLVVPAQLRQLAGRFRCPCSQLRRAAAAQFNRQPGRCDCVRPRASTRKLRTCVWSELKKGVWTRSLRDPRGRACGRGELSGFCLTLLLALRPQPGSQASAHTHAGRKKTDGTRTR